MIEKNTDTGFGIPKVIHYCWFGGKPLPASAINCIESWKKYLQGYEIREWNETNFDISCCEYVKEAYAAKKWAFVSDYARFWILYKFGGLYFDTDVEVIKPLDDLVKAGPFMGCELSTPATLSDSNELESDKVAPGLGLAANPGLGLYKEILDYYGGLHFDLDHIETVVDHTTKILMRRGFKGDGTVECIDGVYIYPPEYFCPMDQWTGKITTTPNTRSIHHYTATWQTPYSKFKSRLQKILGKKITDKIIAFKRKLKGM